jgi:hypothetical protein
VVGAYRGPLARAIKGSFTQHLAYHARCPVLVVGPGAEECDEERDSGGGRPARIAAAPRTLALPEPSPA